MTQSLADLRKGYAYAAKIQSEQDRQAAINRASVDAAIDANTPAMGVQFVNHRDEQYEVGDSAKISSSDAAWTMPTEKLRTNLELAQELYGKNGALNKLLQSGSPQDAQRAIELEDRLRRSMGEAEASGEMAGASPIEQPAPQARPETFPDGSLYQISDLLDGQLQVQLITGEIFKGDPLTVTKKIAEAKVHTTRWGQEWRQKAEAQQQPQNGNGQGPWEGAPTAILPNSAVQYDLSGQPLIEPGQSVIPDQTFAQLHQMSQALGYTDANEMIADQLALRARTEQIGQELAVEREDRQNKETAAVFLPQHPDFPNDQKSIDAIGDLITQNNLPWTAENMAMAHAYAVKNGMYQPLSQEAIEAAVGLTVQARRPTPPPMIRTGNPERGWQGENDPYKIPWRNSVSRRSSSSLRATRFADVPIGWLE